MKQNFRYESVTHTVSVSNSHLLTYLSNTPQMSMRGKSPVLQLPRNISALSNCLATAVPTWSHTGGWNLGNCAATNSLKRNICTSGWATIPILSRPFERANGKTKIFEGIYFTSQPPPLPHPPPNPFIAGRPGVNRAGSASSVYGLPSHLLWTLQVWFLDPWKMPVK